MTIRIIVWAATVGLLGGVVADYSTYDSSGNSTLIGALVGTAIGAGVGLLIHIRQRGKSR